MVITRSQNTNTNIASSLFKEKKRGFFGRLWNKIKQNVGAIVGAIVGGPLGAALGSLIDSWLAVNPDIVVTQGRTTELGLDAINEDAYPISPSEEKRLFDWLNNEFKPTIIKIANTTDQDLTLTFARTTASASIDKITIVNKALKDISVLKAYALKLLEFGETYTTLLGEFRLSDNYVINKTEAMFLVLDQIEKGTLKYVVDNQLDTNYKLVADNQLISTISNVDKVNLNWQGQSVTSSIKRYVATQDVTQDQTPLDVTDVDLTSDQPAVHTSSEVIDVQGDPKPQTNWLKVGVIGTLSYMALRKITKSDKK